MTLSSDDVNILRKGLSKGKFPIRWVTYRRRIQEDVRIALSKSDSDKFFSRDYVNALTASAKELEAWELKLLATQFAIYVFFVLSYLSSDPSLSIFGISAKHTPGLKEMLILISATLAAASQVIRSAKETKIMVAEIVLQESPREEFKEFAKLSAPASFHLKLYMARNFDLWMFPTIATRALFVLLVALLGIVTTGLVVFSISVSLFVLIDIFRAPTMGVISYAVLSYAAVCSLLILVWTVRMHFPLPFRDKSALKRLGELEKRDFIAYSIAMEKIASDNLIEQT